MRFIRPIIYILIATFIFTAGRFSAPAPTITLITETGINKSSEGPPFEISDIQAAQQAVNTKLYSLRNHHLVIISPTNGRGFNYTTCRMSNQPFLGEIIPDIFRVAWTEAEAHERIREAGQQPR